MLLSKRVKPTKSVSVLHGFQYHILYYIWTVLQHRIIWLSILIFTAGRQKNTEKGQGHPKGQDLQEDQDHIHQSLEQESIFLQEPDILDTIEEEVEDTINHMEGA